MNDELLRSALALVNDARRALGMEELEAMPKGLPIMAHCCPVTRALRPAVRATASYYVRPESPVDSLALAAAWGVALSTYKGGVVVPLPDPLVRFTTAFDAGKFPELEEDGDG